MEDIKIFMKENLYEEIIYENEKGDVITGCIKGYSTYENKLKVALDKIEIIIDNIIKNLTFLLEYGELSISSESGIHKFYMI